MIIIQNRFCGCAASSEELARVSSSNLVDASSRPDLAQRGQLLDELRGSERLAHEYLPQACQGMGSALRRDHGGHHYELRVQKSPLIRVCPTCANIQDKPFDLHIEQAVLAEPCPKCGYHFPMMPETRESTAVFKDVPGLATPL
jgi:hypothetical protein